MADDDRACQIPLWFWLLLGVVIWLLLVYLPLSAASSIPPLHARHAASYREGLNTGIASLYPGSIAPFSSFTAAAGTVPLPVELAGVQVRIDGSPAPLFFVAPNQINLLVASWYAGKSVNVAVVRDGIYIYHSVFVVTPSFGVFTANAQGFGLAAGLVFVPATGTYQPTAMNANQPVSVSIGTAANPNYLILFGTGLRGNAVVLIDNVACPTTFAGEHPSLVGVDQINAQLVPQLAGKGWVDVVVMTEQGESNTVKIFIE